MKIGFLFPGQGSQSVGMGKDFLDETKKYEENKLEANFYNIAKTTYERVKKITNIDVANLSINGPEEKLNETKNTQICILSMSLAILEILKQNGINAQISSGLSLGEYTALIYSKAINFEDGVKLVQKRGEYMQSLVPEGEWLMAAILGISEEQVQNVCKQVKNGFAVPVNFNCTGQIVISGDKQGVEEAEILAKEAGAKKVRELKTAGPFHTKKLQKASDALRQELEKIEIHDFETKVAKNLDGKIYTKQDNIREILSQHVVSPVRFDKCLETMLQMGVDTFIEIGPGKTLSGFVKRMTNEKEINILNINSVETLKSSIDFIKNINCKERSDV